MRWQRPARWLLGAFLVGFIVLLALRMRTRPRAADSPPPAVLSGGEIVRGTNGEFLLRNLTVHYGRQATFEGGRTRLFDVRATGQTDGRKFELTAPEAEQIPQAGTHGQIILTGTAAQLVKLTTEDGLTVTTPRATYDDQTQIVQATDRVAFTRGRLSGSGVGATYDRQRDVLWLLEQAHVTEAPDETGAGQLDVTSGAAGLARADRYLRFERNVRIASGSRVIDSDVAVARLSADEKRLETLELRGHARVGASGAAAGGLESMQSTDMDLALGSDGRALQHATLMGGAVMTVASAPPQAARRIAARTIDLGFAPDGTTVTSLQAAEGVQVDLPADAQNPARQIRSAALQASGDATGGLRTAVFSGGVDFTESRPAGAGVSAVNRTARAERLEAATAPGLGSIERAHFLGNVMFEEGTTSAGAADAVYDIGRSTIDLQASSKNPGPRTPWVDDDRVHVSAGRIVLTVGTRKLNASTNVQSVIQPAPAGKPGAAPTAKLPTLLAPDRQVNVHANALAYDGDLQTATYTGRARLWQDRTRLDADTIRLDQQSGNLSASGGVTSVMMLQQGRGNTGTSEPAQTTAKGEEFEYVDAARRATYRTKAQVVSSEGTIDANRIEMYLKPSGNELERSEAYDAVTARIGEGRTAHGTRLTYFPDEQKYVMSGNPVELQENTKDGCQRTLAAALTFVRSTDTIDIIASTGPRTITTAGPCPERRR